MGWQANLIIEFDWESLSIIRDDSGRSFIPTEIDSINYLLDLVRPHHVAEITIALNEQYGFGFEEVDFSFPEDEDEEMWEGVKVYNPLGEVFVPIAAFQKLMRAALAQCDPGGSVS